MNATNKPDTETTDSVHQSQEDSLQDLYGNVNWKTLRKQKLALMKVIDSGIQREHMESLLGVIDHFQDIAVSSGRFSSEEVFDDSRTVNLYFHTTITVPKAANARDAAILAFNGNYLWDIGCQDFEVSWSFNDCMMIDVSDENDVDVDEFEPSDIGGEEMPAQDELGGTFKVSFYTNVEVIVKDFDDNDHAIASASEAEITGDLISVEGYKVDMHFSDSVQPSLVGRDEDEEDEN